MGTSCVLIRTLYKATSASVNEYGGKAPKDLNNDQKGIDKCQMIRYYCSYMIMSVSVQWCCQFHFLSGLRGLDKS